MSLKYLQVLQHVQSVPCEYRLQHAHIQKSCGRLIGLKHAGRGGEGGFFRCSGCFFRDLHLKTIQKNMGFTIRRSREPGRRPAARRRRGARAGLVRVPTNNCAGTNKYAFPDA